MPAGRPRKPIDAQKNVAFRASGTNPTALAVVPMHSETEPVLNRSLDEAVNAIVYEGASWLSITDVRLNFLRELL